MIIGAVIAGIIVSILLSAYFSGSEMAFSSLFLSPIPQNGWPNLLAY